MQLGALLWGERARRLLRGCLRLEVLPDFSRFARGSTYEAGKRTAASEYSALPHRKDYSWPGGKRLAVHFCLNVEHFSFRKGLGTITRRRIRSRTRAASRGATTATASAPGGCSSSPRPTTCPTGCPHVNPARLYDYCPQMAAAFSKRGDEIVGHGRTNAERQADLPLCREPIDPGEPPTRSRSTKASGRGLARALHLADARLTGPAARGRLPLYDGLAARRPAGLVPHAARPNPLHPLRARSQRSLEIISWRTPSQIYCENLIDQFDEMLEESRAGRW